MDTLFPKTIGDILASFKKTIDALDKLIERNRSKIAVHADRIVDLSDKNHVLAVDSSKAAVVARKLRELIAE